MILDSTLVKKLISSQFPQWKNLPIKPVAVGGWDNRTFHLGDKMLVRIPSSQKYALQVEKEQQWLPKLASLLPLAIPEPLQMGEACEQYPWRWSIYRWIEGETAAAAAAQIIDLDDFAKDLAQFLIALQKINIAGGPIPKPQDFSHISGLVTYNLETKKAIAALQDKIDTEIATEIWEEALNTTWQYPLVWVHGDISAGNLLVTSGKLSTVIDFGGLGVGDPACDLVIAWKFFGIRQRKIFREILPLDEGTWSRARAWALWKALIIAAGFTKTNAVESARTWHTINEVITDYKSRTKFM